MRRWLFLPRFNPTSQLFLIRSKQTTNFPAFWFAIYSMRTRAFYCKIYKYFFFYHSWLIQTLHEVYILCLISQNFIDVEHVPSHIERFIYCILIHYILDMQFLINKLSITTYNLQVVTVALTYIIITAGFPILWKIQWIEIKLKYVVHSNTIYSQ